jgi:hypothetical protein
VSIWFSTGNEHAPDDPFGRIVLEIDDDGAAKLEHFVRTGDGAWTGRMDPAQLQRLRAAMERGGFPNPPPHPMPVPGATIFELELDDGSGPKTLMMPLRDAAKVDGYGEALEILQSFARELSGGAYQRGAAAT